MILVAHTLKTSYCVSSRWTFRPDVKEADCCQQQGGGRAHCQSGDGVRCWPGRHVEREGEKCSGGVVWGQGMSRFVSLEPEPESYLWRTLE